MHPSPFLLGGGGLNLLPNFQKGGGGGWNPLPIFQKGGGGGLDRTSVFRGGLLGKRRVNFFRGWLQFLDKKIN